MGSQTKRWPDQLWAFLQSNFGDITNTTFLSGVAGDGGAHRLQFNSQTSAIVKSSPLQRERNFYENHADDIRRLGIGVPNLCWSGADDSGRHWIVIEDIPNSFPEKRWLCDPEQIETLFRLHSGTWGDKRLALSAEAYNPGWVDEMTSQACQWFDDGTERINVVNQVTVLQQEAQSQLLFWPLCCLSADPNPTNWRVREEGELVLIDWERFSHGHPAIDLASTMPGLGSRTMEGKIAELYRTCWERNEGSLPAELHNLERLIRQAKLWSVVEFMANARQNPELYPAATVAYIVKELQVFLDAPKG